MDVLPFAVQQIYFHSILQFFIGVLTHRVHGENQHQACLLMGNTAGTQQHLFKQSQRFEGPL